MTECSETLFPFEAHFSRPAQPSLTAECRHRLPGSRLFSDHEHRISPFARDKVFAR